VKAELDQAGKLADPVDLDREAERLADTAMDLGERLTDADPAVVREVLRQFVARIECQWETTTGKSKSRSRLVGGDVDLHEQTPFSVFGVVALAP
jgi:hypothetical protein